MFFFFKHKTAYDMRISDWSSDVCSSDLDIKINGAIGTVAAQTIVDRCAEGVQAFCEAVVRGPNDFGNNLQVFESPFNFAVQRATGIDFEGSYRKIGRAHV